MEETNIGSVEQDWPENYFNYFTEIEEHFRKARGTGLFLLSPLDWALIENWRSAGVPLQAVLKGIDAAFEKWHSRKSKRRLVNSLAYCAQAVMDAAQRAPRAESARGGGESPFSADDISRHLQSTANVYKSSEDSALLEIGTSLDKLAQDAGQQARDLESLEQRLTALEEKAVAILRSKQSEEALFELRRQLNEELRMFRSKMTADQISALERRYLDTALLERAKLPRLSLFYLH
ncbi:MAG: hypothetical protein ACJ746_15010 [Bryobacteraceae bacterium]